MVCIVLAMIGKVIDTRFVLLEMARVRGQKKAQTGIEWV